MTFKRILLFFTNQWLRVLYFCSLRHKTKWILRFRGGFIFFLLLFLGLVRGFLVKSSDSSLLCTIYEIFKHLFSALRLFLSLSNNLCLDFSLDLGK